MFRGSEGPQTMCADLLNVDFERVVYKELLANGVRMLGRYMVCYSDERSPLMLIAMCRRLGAQIGVILASLAQRHRTTEGQL